PSATVTRAPFGQVDGTPVEIFTIASGSGMEVRATAYGAAIVSVRVPDRRGAAGDGVLGFGSPHGYRPQNQYCGVVVGRYGNRIAKGHFAIDGTTYTLATNNGENHLHGGVKGFDKAVWKAEPFTRDPVAGVVFTLTSPDGEEGYPGTLNVTVT